MTRNERRRIIDAQGNEIRIARPDLLRIGHVVIIRGLFRNRPIAGLVTRIHPLGIDMTDVDGDLVPWHGDMPIIDAIIVDALKLQDRESGVDYMSDTMGQPMHISKVPWIGDIERRASWKGLPPMITETAPRYIVIGELHGV